MTHIQVIVVGSFVQDLNWTCVEFPTAGQTILGEFSTGPGGKGSNQAVAAGRAGASTLFIGAIGNDGMGQGAKDFYKREGIRHHFVKKERPTGTAAILVNKAGQNEIVVALGANEELNASDFTPAAFLLSKIVVTQLETNLSASKAALQYGKAAGATTILNPAPMRPDFSFDILKDVDILIPNETEFVTLLNLKDPTLSFSEAKLTSSTADQIHALARTLGVATVIVTLGSRGCLVSKATGSTFINSFKVKAVDTTGAGDAFVGGFAAGLLKHNGNIDHAAIYGSAVAALSVTKKGTAPAMPTEAEITAFLS